jgi:hypothetical protein
LPAHRKDVAEWVLLDRAKEAKVPQSRGWEKTGAVGKQLGVAGGLTGLLKSKDGKVHSNYSSLHRRRFIRESQLQEVALNALAALVKDNPSAASVLAKPSQDRESMYFSSSITQTQLLTSLRPVQHLPSSPLHVKITIH